MTSIRDIALRAGASVATVSRVINRRPNVKDAVRVRVQQAIDDLGYVPNLSARRMGGARSYLILAVNDRQRTLENWQAGRGNDWVDQMLYGGMTECERNGYHLVFELIDTDGRVFKLSSLRGKIVLIYFGYTGCPDACPTDLLLFRELMQCQG